MTEHRYSDADTCQHNDCESEATEYVAFNYVNSDVVEHLAMCSEHKEQFGDERKVPG